MQIWPAIDLRGGKCVRLRQGDYAQETVFNDEPAAVARMFADAGARCLHVVDLDGAREGAPVNLPAVEEILDVFNSYDEPCHVELGGGVRDEQAIAELLDFGLDRLVVGTSAIKHTDWFEGIVERFPGKLVLGVDARDGLVATDGWLETSQTNAVELAQRFIGKPLAAIVYTDIATDGMMQGPNVAAMAEMQAAMGSLPVVASGGVTTLDDVQRLKDAGLAAAIIGRALYEGTIDLSKAIAIGNS
ncbi:1-(5-phosphoribosyl)-5-[(5-phosphoribosylamino)methylideneamino]imidazole-4-carboxamide isomerase [Botrimarina mediterranea]|uniref:1-(5-phosphoribosyl)-5-[(5-phosphoribosylamino)methylideneamino] imidazole-4-carboxamide isomerase n=1 Tax=Botrimarina mediterranea TaxID=2528022 RepID=A0A518KBQ1_9BACT|nr:1-(5-phosphoribosyl)-5-[(5-phosphoribosylamino)methylideneamino]imidazole-4-carboxamide isomerase [Botrimarina mediterranea]QDV75226.1 1-(5-phosphoribosyl)-5-[(5-phosphoribosylamino)methylideneamino] imidazole-4-carboxamide isomerase [Botrimarina mediterranea]QDV79895.1 1-(5-phosphoribosyl)-5-[(5-phosphoribosylamino)methylideneamino] imidazole-4-carboxamide isomerase [Planctomycetes bacterium K2D]CAE7280605.1 hisA [Symbiodinium sp. CCMP2456]